MIEKRRQTSTNNFISCFDAFVLPDVRSASSGFPEVNAIKRTTYFQTHYLLTGGAIAFFLNVSIPVGAPGEIVD